MLDVPEEGEDDLKEGEGVLEEGDAGLHRRQVDILAVGHCARVDLVRVRALAKDTAHRVAQVVSPNRLQTRPYVRHRREAVRDVNVDCWLMKVRVAWMMASRSSTLFSRSCWMAYMFSECRIPALRTAMAMR